MSVPVYVEVSDKYLWALRPFSYLFNIFWSELQPVTVFGYSRPDFDLPTNFRFVSIAEESYPANKWSDGLIEFLLREQETHFVLLLVDYWLCRTVDVGGVGSLADLCRMNPAILRMDLTTDRLYAGSSHDIGYWGHYDLVEAGNDEQYQFSLQASIWNRSSMLSVLERGKTPWEVEVHTTLTPDMRVFGSRQYPVRYANGILKGRLDLKQIDLIQQPHRDAVLRMIPPNMEISERTITDIE
jgi:hypothetical protein